MKRRSERGSAVLVVLTLTVVIAALLMVNARTVHQLQQDLQRVEKRQQDRYTR